MCAFNHEGECLIYPVRPMACRTAHAVNTSTHCHPADDSGVKPQRIAFVPLEDLTTISRRVMRAADRAARGPTAGHESLVKLVAGALMRRGD
jgi:Fe-S-cluster containining protein